MFTYRISGGKSDIPCSPTVVILPRVWSTDTHGNVILTSRCMTEGELDYDIDALIRGLERVRQQAKYAMRRAHRRLNARLAKS